MATHHRSHRNIENWMMPNHRVVNTHNGSSVTIYVDPMTDKTAQTKQMRSAKKCHRDYMCQKLRHPANSIRQAFDVEWTDIDFSSGSICVVGVVACTSNVRICFVFLRPVWAPNHFSFPSTYVVVGRWLAECGENLKKLRVAHTESMCSSFSDVVPPFSNIMYIPPCMSI